MHKPTFIKIFLAVCFVMLLFAPPSNGRQPDKEGQGQVQPKKFDLESYKMLMPLIKEQNDQYMEDAFAALRKGDMNKAMDLFFKASKNAPYDPRPYMHLANIYFEFGKDDLALKVLERAGRFKTSHDAIFRHLRYREAGDDSPRKEEFSRISIAPFKGNKQAAVTFFFDDGPKSVYTKALPILDEFEYKATIAINPGVIGDNGTTHPAYGTWEDWLDVSQRGHEIANHGFDHIGLSDQSPESLEYQINRSYDQITRRIGKPPLSFVFPADMVNSLSIKKAMERHIALRSHDLLTRVYDKIFITIYGGNFFSAKTGERVVDLAIYKRLWLIAQCHAIETEGLRTYKPITEEFLKSHLSYIKENEDQIWVDTFINVYLYLVNRKNAKLELVKDSKRKLTFSLRSSLVGEEYKYPLTIIINTSPLKSRKASAVQEGNSDPLDVVIDGQKLYVTVLPSEAPIYVKWK